MKRAPLALLFLLALVLGLPAATPAGAALQVSRQAGGEPGPALAVGAHLYQALGPSIVTWSSSAAAPAIENISEPLPGLVTGLAQAGSHLYAAVRTSYPNGFLAVFSLADPARPRLVDLADYSASFLSSPGGLIASGGRLYLADSEVGIVVADLTNPASPTFSVGYSGFVPNAETALSAGRLVTWGQSFFGNLTVQVFDLAAPNTPSSLGTFDAGLALAGGVDGNFFYAIGFGLEIFDFSNLGNVQSVFQNGDAASRDILLSPGRLHFGNETGLHVWNVTSPASASEIAVVPATLGRSEQSALIAVGGELKLVFFTQESRGLRFSAADPPVLEHDFSLPGAVDATAVSDRGDRLFAGDFYSGLRVLDRAGLAATGRFDVPAGQLGAVEGIRVIGDRAYLANWGFGLLIADLTNPAAPTLVGSVAIDFATDVEVVGSHAYVVSSTNGGFLYTVDIANPASPQVVGSVALSKGTEILYHGGLLLVADESFGGPGGLRLFSIANPAAPAQIGHYTACDSAGGLTAAGSRAYLACSDGTLHIVDIATPSAPAQLGVFSDPDPDAFGDARDVAVRGGHAYFGRGDFLYSLGVANPASPLLEARANLAAAVRRVALAPSGQPWVAAGPAGIYQLEAGIFADGFESGNTAAWSATVP